MLRFSLAALLLLVLLAALCSAALLYASPLVKQVAITATAALLVLAALAAIYGRGPKRAAAGGLALVGWAYLGLTCLLPSSQENELLTTRASAWLYDHLHPPVVAPEVSGPSMAARDGTGSTSGSDLNFITIEGLGDTVDVSRSVPGIEFKPPAGFSGYVGFTYRGAPPSPRVDRGSFLAVGRALWSLLLGLLGAVVAAVIYGRSRRDAAQAAEE